MLRRARETVKRNIAVLGIGKVRRPEENIHTLAVREKVQRDHVVVLMGLDNGT